MAIPDPVLRSESWWYFGGPFVEPGVQTRVIRYKISALFPVLSLLPQIFDLLYLAFSLNEMFSRLIHAIRCITTSFFIA